MARSPWTSMRRVRPRYGIVLTLAAAAIAAMLGAWLAPHHPISGRAEVVDGDTLRIGGTRIRLTGLDAPEIDQTCSDGQGVSWACGREARGFVVALVAHRAVDCQGSGVDRYGRTLARCSADGADLGAQIVSAGWAVTDMGYLAEATAAQSQKRGIWSGSFIAPAEWRHSHGDAIPNLWDWIRNWFP
jgi:endonuclease YncB( thermonuclease family)